MNMLQSYKSVLMWEYQCSCISAGPKREIPKSIDRKWECFDGKWRNGLRIQTTYPKPHFYFSPSIRKMLQELQEQEPIAIAMSLNDRHYDREDVYQLDKAMTCSSYDRFVEYKYKKKKGLVKDVKDPKETGSEWRPAKFNRRMHLRESLFLDAFYNVCIQHPYPHKKARNHVYQCLKEQLIELVRSRAEAHMSRKPDCVASFFKRAPLNDFKRSLLRRLAPGKLDELSTCFVTDWIYMIPDAGDPLESSYYINIVDLSSKFRNWCIYCEDTFEADWTFKQEVTHLRKCRKIMEEKDHYLHKAIGVCRFYPSHHVPTSTLEEHEMRCPESWAGYTKFFDEIINYLGYVIQEDREKDGVLMREEMEEKIIPLQFISKLELYLKTHDDPDAEEQKGKRERYVVAKRINEEEAELNYVQLVVKTIHGFDL